MSSNRELMYIGFLSALAKQTAFWSDDPVISRLLELKKTKIDRFYRSHPREEGWISMLRDWSAKAYARTVPWPIQQVVTRFSEARFEPDAKLLAKISRDDS